MILPEHEAKELLEKAHVPVIPTRIIDSWEDIEAEIEKIGYPVVLKLSSGRFSHKTEIGGVHLNIQDEPQLTRAHAELVKLRNELDDAGAIIIESMAPAGAEFFIGIQRREGFGPVMSFGLGGVWLELFKDVTFRLLPAKRSDFHEMLTELKTWPKLRDGFRSLAPVGAESVLDVMERVSQFVMNREEIQEMDLNPILAYADRTVVVDARIVTR